MTASSYVKHWYQPEQGRLNFNRAWRASTPGRRNEWLQIDFGQLFEVCGVATQGNGAYGMWVTPFKLSYSQDGKYCIRYRDENGNEKVFHRYGGRTTVDQHKLKRIYARYIRFYLTNQHRHNCLRVEVYGTDVSACFGNAVGVANPYIIQPSMMSASSSYASSHRPFYGRLNYNRKDGWCAYDPDRNDDWLQVDLGQQFLVCGVASQGDSQYDPWDSWVTAFKLFYSQDKKHWKIYRDENGNDMINNRVELTAR
ncbi:lactadherin-like [Oculina patagonica]